MHILIALDYLSPHDLLLEKAVQFGKSMDGSLTVLHVFSFMQKNQAGEDPAIAFSSLPTAEVSDIDFDTWRQAARESELKLQVIVEQMRSAGLMVQGQHILGQPGPVICARAETLQADVIMIGRRHQSSQTFRSLGSVSNFVVHHAPCSVWIIQEEG